MKEVISVKNLTPIEAIKVILDSLLKKNSEYTKIIVNAQLGTFLQDAFASQCFNAETEAIRIDPTIKPEIYKIFKIKEAEIFIDPKMNWDDCRAILIKGEDKKEIVIEHSNNLI